MDEGDIEVWINQINKSGILINARKISAPYQNHKGIEGEIKIDERQFKLQVILPPTFPSALPVIFLADAKSLDYLAHIDNHGLICYKESEGIIVDRRKPAGVIEWSITEAKNVLQKGLTGENRYDFTEEFEAYWAYLKGEELYNLTDFPSSSGETLLFSGSEHKIKFIAQTQNAILSFFGLNKHTNKYTIQNISYFVFPANTLLIPPKPGEPFWTVEELKVIAESAIDLLTSKQRKKYIDQKKALQGIIIFLLPRIRKGYSLFAVSYQSPDKIHPLAEGAKNIRLKPVTVVHCEKSYLVPRGGGNVNLSTKKVLLIGCGSVGGPIAYELVRSGILNLTLVDPDKFTLENTYRHVMGNSKLNKFKASALKEDILHKYPYLSCNAIDKTIEEAIEKESLDLSNFDLIMVAIGTPTTELWINELIRKQYKTLTAIYTWLEPLGIGGHALLVMPNQKGCLECLYSSEDEEFYLFNRASFAAPGQHFATSLTGCNNLFTPYGSLDASSTAVMAVKTALHFLLGKENQSALYSWKGESEEFLAHGYILSDRYNLSQEQLNEHRYSFAVDSCKICGN